MRVSRQSSLPKKNGELAPIASCTPAIACAAFQWREKSSGSTSWCSWTLVHAASGAIESAYVDRRSTPPMLISRSSPRCEDLLVDELVPRVRGEDVDVEELLGDRRQDPDDHHVVAGLAGALVGVVEARADRLLEHRERAPLEEPRRDVDLHV